MSTCTDAMPQQLTHDLERSIRLTILLKEYSKLTIKSLWYLACLVFLARRARKIVTTFLEKDCLYQAESQPEKCLGELYQMVDRFRDHLLSLQDLNVPNITHGLWRRWWENELDWWDDAAETCYLGIHGKKLIPLLDELASKL